MGGTCEFASLKPKNWRAYELETCHLKSGAKHSCVCQTAQELKYTDPGFLSKPDRYPTPASAIIPLDAQP